jgi:hypothetical protein
MIDMNVKKDINVRKYKKRKHNSEVAKTEYRRRRKTDDFPNDCIDPGKWAELVWVLWFTRVQYPERDRFLTDAEYEEAWLNTIHQVDSFKSEHALKTISGALESFKHTVLKIIARQPLVLSSSSLEEALKPDNLVTAELDVLQAIRDVLPKVPKVVNRQYLSDQFVWENVMALCLWHFRVRIQWQHLRPIIHKIMLVHSPLLPELITISLTYLTNFFDDITAKTKRDEETYIHWIIRRFSVQTFEPIKCLKKKIHT